MKRAFAGTCLEGLSHESTSCSTHPKLLKLFLGFRDQRFSLRSSLGLLPDSCKGYVHTSALAVVLHVQKAADQREVDFATAFGDVKPVLVGLSFSLDRAFMHNTLAVYNGTEPVGLAIDFHTRRRDAG